jgi:predicted metal-dependent phosphoesterase TrpH
MAPVNQLRVELHCHTVHSFDGHIEFDGLVRAARLKKLDVICITDHDKVEGAIEFQKRCQAAGSDLHIIVGEERTLADRSHVIGLFLKEPIASDTFEEVVREIHEQGGLCTLPHPFRHRDGALRELKRPMHRVSAFEIFNPKCTLEQNKQAHSLCGTGLVAVGGSDAHYECDLGECVNVVPFTGNIEDSLKHFLQGQAQGRYEVLGIHQNSSGKGRQYAPFYYRIKPYVRVPRPLVPAAWRLYRAYRNSTSRWKTPKLETKYVSE